MTAVIAPVLAEAVADKLRAVPRGNSALRLFPSATLWALFIGASFAFSLRDFAGSAMTTSASLFLQNAHGFSPKFAGFALAGIFLASAISNPLFGHFSEGGRMRWVCVLLLLAAFLISLFPRVPVPWMTPVLLAYGFFFLATYPIVEAALMESVPDAIRGRIFGLFITVGGLVGNLSHWLVGGWMASVLGVVTCLGYLLAYTPLKKRTVWATFVGAFPGAIPPMIGWVAASGKLDQGAWLLFLILFFWQFPHFHAISWMYREDYARAGIQMLPVVDRDGTRTFRQIIITAGMLVGVSVLPSVLGLAGVLYFFGALVLSTALVQVCLWASSEKTNVRAKWLMHATILHIPILLGLMAYDKIAR